MKSNTTKLGVFYRSNGRWTPYRNQWTGRPKVFTSEIGVQRFLKDDGFKFDKNYILKSKISVRKLSK
jgi:hypothetical protein